MQRSTADRAFEPGALLRLAAPLVLSFWMRSAFSFVDTIYAATLGDAAVAAIGLSIPFEFLFIAVWVGLSNGLTATLGEAFGARDAGRVEALVRVVRWMTTAAVPLFVLLGLALWWLAPTLPIDSQVARYFGIYTAVLIGGTGLTGFWSVIPDSLIKAHYQTRVTMKAGVLSNSLNLFLNTLFLFVFHWGILGIALSTVIGRLGGLLYALKKAAGFEARRRRQWAADAPRQAPSSSSAPPVSAASSASPDPSPSPAVEAATSTGLLNVRTPARAILALALPASLSFGLMATESAVVNRILATFDQATAAIAAFAIFHRVAMFAGMPLIAISAASLPFFARAHGAGNGGAMRRGLLEGSLASVVYVVAAVGPITYWGAEAIARSLAEAPATIAFATFALRMVPLSGLATIPFVLCRPVFDGMQQGAPGAIMASVRYLGLTLPAAWGGAHVAAAFGYPRFNGVVLGLITAGLLVSSVFLAWTVRKVRQLADA